MAENEKEACLALIAAHDPEIRTLPDQGFAFVTNAFKAGADRLACRPGQIGNMCEDCNRKAIR